MSFEDAQVAGRAAKAARFGRGTYFWAHPLLAANGGGRYVNRYTLILDVMFPDRSPSGGWAALLQTSTGNLNDGDWFVNPQSGIGISGVYAGLALAGEWHRLGFSVDLVAGTLDSYLDGVRVSQVKGQPIDGRFALYSLASGPEEGLLLFADDDGENSGGLVAAVQIRDQPLCPDDMAAIGGIAQGPLSPDPIAEKICSPPVQTGLKIKEGPYLQWATTSEITVMWETTLPADTTLSYRRAGGDWQAVSRGGAARIHEVRLSGFDPAEAVEYTAASKSATESVKSGLSSFRTNPLGQPPFRFVIFGDNHVNPPVFSKLVLGMVGEGPDLTMSCGDVVNDGNNNLEWGEGFLTPLQPLARSVPFYVAIGNHERNAEWFYDYVAQPGNEHWFSFDYAGCHFTILDTNYPFGPGTEQYRWVEGDLSSPAAQGSKFLFVFHHHPAYSELVEEVIYAQVRMHLVPLFEAAGVDLDFSGHIHDYERGIYLPPDTGRRIGYIQTSGAGGQLWDDEYSGDWEQITKVVQYVYHYCEVSIDGDNLSFRAIDLNGNVIDNFTLQREARSAAPPPPEAVETQWDFARGDLAAAFGPGKLEFLDGPAGATASGSRFATTGELGLPPIGGKSSHVLAFPRATSAAMGLRATPEFPANGGGLLANEYTIIADLLIGAENFAGPGWLAIYNTSPSNGDDAEAFVRFPDGGVGISGAYAGQFGAGTWRRLALVLQSSEGRTAISKYLDGALVGTQLLGAIDGRWAIAPSGSADPHLLLFADDNGETAAGFLGSLLLSSRAYRPEEIAALSAPRAGGILSAPCLPPDCVPFQRGDANQDGAHDLSDGVFVLQHLFAGTAPTTCEKALDSNDDGALDISDAVHLLTFLYLGGRAPPAPFPYCGGDPSGDALSCLEFKPCSR